MLLKGDLGISHLQREDAFSFYPIVSTTETMDM
jgi:hypothetical protein